MAWLKVDDGLPDHRKFRRLSDGAVGLWLRGSCYASKYLTDGFLDAEFVEDELGTKARRRLADELVAAGRWLPSELGYEIHAYLEHNPSRAQVLARREARQEAGRRGGLAGRGKPDLKAVGE